MNRVEQRPAYIPFLNHLKTARQRLLMLDYDGTLAPFRVDRSEAMPYPGVRDALREIMLYGTRVVLVSGRSTTDLLQLDVLELRPEIWGSHGRERLCPDGTYQTSPISDEQRLGLMKAAAWARAEGLENRLEFKPGSIAMHWRGLPGSAIRDTRDRLLPAWSALAEDFRLSLLPFDGGTEIRVPDKTKGDAVRTILAEAGEDCAAAYLGDDQTDEDAFRSIKGRGLAILVGDQPRPTSADLWLKPPEELLQFFDDWLHASRGEG